MQLGQLIAALPDVGQALVTDEALAMDITAITADSRRAQPGALFVAYAGVSVDGHDFIDQAVAAGAAAVVGEREWKEIRGMRGGTSFPSFPSFPYVRVGDGRQALAYLCAAWHGFPARRLKVIGVTGTDGKTTVTFLIHAVLTAAGHRTGMISTVSARIGERSLDTGLHTTTPDAPEVQAYLAQMVAAASEYAVLEATSHGLAQQRVAACDFDVAVVTNITHEHLDFHGSPEAYLAAKAMLFESLSRSQRKPGVPKVAILNADDSSFQRLRRIPADVQITYGLSESADVRATDIRYSPSATRFTVQAHSAVSKIRASSFQLQTSLIGEYNVYNCLAAAAVGLSQGLTAEAIQNGIASVKGVVGRMERIDEGQDFLAIVDFAHTPRALEVALETVRRLAEGRVIVVFGCAGLRDVQKRPWMGRIAGRLADRVVITAEDPRTEPLEEIMAQIAAGCQEAGRRESQDYWRIGNRAEAIRFAVHMARPGDVLLVTGKGHEQSMCLGNTEYPWSDHAALGAALRGERLPESLAW
ncbi:MAG: UDP-N-acetylmuramoyl-L-alanyl-D-glutamate--2,6-diaminopimelate ligase [Anaerolineae bacterium]|nr:UDP-N-acetylmuramoyl-L-alanyl-D-glutamate--2,6-diaminopimelate ligase [Anaerolineae bacterium]